MPHGKQSESTTNGFSSPIKPLSSTEIIQAYQLQSLKTYGRKQMPENKGRFRLYDRMIDNLAIIELNQGNFGR